MTIGGQAAFVAYISPTQINAQVPSNAQLGSQQVTVDTPAGNSGLFSITVSASMPGLLAPAAFNLSGKQYVGALFSDGSTFVLPRTRPAKPGDTITIYGVGFGAVTPSYTAGQIVSRSNTLTTPLQVFFGDTQAMVTYMGLSPGSVGLYQFNVVVPTIPTNNAVPITFTLGRTMGLQTLYTAVQD